ncbi:MAG: hypothetical protein QOH08_564 [Chloroflexota bacterium]|jgi:hypothetical protein|nr:hypothetical protein [Chloroflexota bacterium]
MSLRRGLAFAVLVAACAPAAVTPAVTSGTVRTAAVSGTLPPTSAPLPTASGTAITTAAERDIWTQVVARLPRGDPVAMPTWLPGTLDRDHVAITTLVADAADPRYVVTYSGAGRSIELGMGGPGPGQPSGQSGLGTRVRRSAAVLSFPSSLFTDPSGPALRIVRWQEGGRVLWISSSTYPGGDLLRVAWELDPTGAPTPPSARVREGACASSAKPEDTVDRLMALIGAGDTDAVLDCFAQDVGFANWATLPMTADRVSRRVGEVGGRVYVQGTWKFVSEPAGGAWTQGSSGSQFFQLGLESGRWRVFEGGTAAYGSPP